MSIQQGLSALRATRDQDAAPAPPAPPPAAPPPPAEAPQAPPPEQPQEPPQEAPPEQPEGEPAPPEQTYKVKVGGEERDVALSELLAGYSRNSDYTQKMQAVSEQRRAAEAEIQQAQQARAQYLERINQATDVMRSSYGPEPDWDRLAAEDPARYLLEERKWNRLRGVEQERARVTEEYRAVEGRRLAEHVKAETNLLVEKLPALRDRDTFRGWQGDIRAYGREVGFTDAEMDQAYDHRHLVILDKSRRYDRLMAAKPPQAQPQQGQPPVLAPGSGSQRPLAGAAAASHAVRTAQSSFDEKPSLRNALAVLRANNTAPRRR
jgi:hypothetical protein